MKRCTVCARTSSSKLVYDLPCERGACPGVMVSDEVIHTPVDNKGSEFFEEPTTPGHTTIVVSTLPEMSRQFVVARVVPPVDRFEQVLAFIVQRAGALEDLGACAEADLLRNLIAAIRVEFRS